jgi:fructan beta-fructosidase
MKRLLLCLFTCCFSVLLFAQNDDTPTPQWRPVYHFTPEKYWTNDPNGLIYLNGEYHLYNQQNPFENKWGHMSWGHATSIDLVHWKHLPIAIPEKIDKDTTWIFSGSAVWDKNNTSGFCKNGGCLVAIYTADQPNLHKESQFIAYSNDGGMTFTNYANNPVIDLQKKDFRDPNVFWYEPLKKWLMTVVLPAEYKARFYTSSNLKEWTLLSEFGPQGFTASNWECPFLIQLPVEGSNQKKWVLFISAGGPARGSYMQYFVGEFDGKEFKNDNPADTILTVDYGDCFYAAIPWNGLPDDQKTFIGWMVPNPQPTSPWKGQMSIPRDLSLAKTSEGIRLVQKPAAVIKNNLPQLSGNHLMELTDVKLNNGEEPVDKNNTIKGNSWWMTAELSIDANATAGFKIAQQKDNNGKTIAETTISYDAANQQLLVDRSNTGGGKVNPRRLKDTVEVKSENGTVKLEILLDKSSLEVFANGGKKVLTTYIYPDENADKIAAFSTGGNATIKSLKIWDLSQPGMQMETGVQALR